MAEHRVGLVQLGGPRLDRGDVGAGGLGHFGHVGLGVGQELVQRRIEEPYRHRQSGHDGEQLDEVLFLVRKELVQGRAALFFGGRDDHLAHMNDPLWIEEHVLGAAEADALAAEIAGGAGVERGLRVGPHLQGAEFVHPLHQLAEITGQLGLDLGNLALENLTAGTVQRDHVAFLENDTAGGQGLGGVVDAQLTGAGDARLSHAAGDDRRMAGHPAAGGQDALGDVHAADILRRGLDPGQDHLLAVLRPGLGLVGAEHDLTGRGARRCRQALAENFLRRLGVHHRMEQLVELRRIDALDRLGLVDHPFLAHLDGDPQRRLGRPLAGAGLEHPELVLLDGELHVLHVGIVGFQLVANGDEFGVQRGQDLFHRRQIGAHRVLLGEAERLRRADAGDHVLALGVDQVFAIEQVLARRRVAGEAHAGRTVVTHVAEHHRLYVDGGAPLRGDSVQLAIGDRPLVHPAAEHGADRAPKLLLRILRERLAEALLNLVLVDLHQNFPVLGGEIGVEGFALLFLVPLEQSFEVVAFHVEHHVAEHLDEPPIAVIGEAFITRVLGEGHNRLVVEAEVEHRIHHSRHRSAGARADRNQHERPGGGAELATHDPLQLGHGGVHLILQIGGIGFAILVVVGAKFGADREARRYRNAETGHLGEVGALAAEQVLHLRATFGLAASERVNPFCHVVIPIPRYVKSPRRLRGPTESAPAVSVC